MNKGLDQKEQYQIINMGQFARGYINLSNINANAHFLLYVLETKQNVNISIHFIYALNDRNIYDYSIYGYKVYEYFRRIEKIDNTYFLYEADGTTVELIKEKENYVNNEKGYILIEQNNEYILLIGSTQYIYNGLNKNYPSEIIVDKNLIKIEEDEQGKLIKITNKKSEVRFSYNESNELTNVGYYENNEVVRQCVIRYDLEDFSIYINYSEGMLSTYATWMSCYHDITIGDENKVTHEFIIDNKKVTTYRKYCIEKGVTKELDKIDFNYETNKTSLTSKNKTNEYKFDNEGKIKEIRDFFDNVTKYEYSANKKLSNINFCSFNHDYINKHNILPQKTDSFRNKFGYTCTSNVTIGLSPIYFKLKSDGSSAIKFEKITKKIPYNGNERDVITLAFKCKFLSFGTQLGSYIITTLRNGKTIKTYDNILKKGEVNLNIDYYVIKTIRIEEPCDEIRLEIKIFELSEAIIYNPAIIEVNNLITYNYDGEKLKSITRGNDFTNYYYDDEESKIITQFDMDSNLNNYGLNSEGYTNSVKNAYGLINSQTFDETDEISINGDVINYGSHDVIEKGSYFDDTYINEMYKYDSDHYLCKKIDIYGNTTSYTFSKKRNSVYDIETGYYTQSFLYNYGNRLVKNEVKNGNEKIAINYEFLGDRISKVIQANYTFGFTYTDDHNKAIKSATLNSVEIEGYDYEDDKLKSIRYGKTNESLTINYDSDDRITNISFVTNSGEQANTQELFKYEYDELNRVIKETECKRNNIINYEYNADGQISKISEGSISKLYNYSDDQLVNRIIANSQHKEITEYIRPHMINEQLKEAFYHKQRVSKKDSKIYYCFFNEVGTDGKRLSKDLKSYCIDENDIRESLIKPYLEEKLPEVTVEKNLNYLSLRKDNNYVTYNYDVFPYKKEIKTGALRHLFYKVHFEEKEENICEMTYGLWFRIKNNPVKNGVIISLGEQCKNSVIVMVDKDLKIKLHVFDAALYPTKLFESDKIIDKNTWHFAAVTMKYDISNLKNHLSVGVLKSCSLNIDGDTVYDTIFDEWSEINLELRVPFLMIGEACFNGNDLIDQIDIDVTNIFYSNNKLSNSKINDIYQSTKENLIECDKYDSVDFQNATSEATVLLNDDLVNDTSIEVFPLHNSLNSLNGVKPISVTVDNKYNLDSRKLFRHLDLINRTCYKAIGQKLVYDKNLLTEGTIQVNAYFINSLNEQCVFTLKDDKKELEVLNVYYKNGILYLGLEFDYDEYSYKTINIPVSEGLNCITLSYKKEQTGDEETTYTVKMYVNGQKFESTVVLPYLTNKHLVYLGRHVNRDGENENQQHFVGATGTYFDMLVLKNKYLTDNEMLDLQKKVNNIVVSDYYNPFGLTTMSSIKSDDAGEEILYHSYEYEKDNEKIIPRVNKETIRYKGNNSRELGYEYDNGNRLIKRNDFNGNTYNYKYNYRNCLIEENINGSILNNVIYKYSYDNNGNILTKSGTVNKLYEYNGCKLVNIYNFGNEEIDESKKGTVAYESISYDGYYPTKVKKYNKNKTLTKSIEYVWRGNKLIQYKSITDSVEVKYEYNSNGLRSKKTVTSGIDSNKTTSETTYAYDGTCLIYECEKKDNVIVSEIYYLYSNKELIGYKKNNEKYYYVKDQTGNISAIIDSTGNFINKYSYDAYGRVIYCLHLNNNGKMRFKGYYYDDETELYWIDSRCYNPKWCRFIQPCDASDLNIYDVNGLNLYSYANNNPIGIAYSSYAGGRLYNGIVVKSRTNIQPSNVGLGSSNKNDWINIKPIPSWVESAIDIADVGFAASIVGLTAWYTLKYPGVAELMKLDGITSIPGKYANLVEGLGYAFVFIETGIDMYNNWQQGQSAGYILASGVYTFGTGMAITWGSAKLGAYIGTSIGGPVGFIVGGVVGIIIGLGLEWLSDEIKELIF